MEEKIKELEKKYNIPEGLLKKARDMEKDKVIYQNRKLVPEIKKLIEQYAAPSN